MTALSAHSARLVPFHPTAAALAGAQQVKGAELPFEDEKFSYVALTRAPVAQHPARVLAQPVISKVEVTAKLCTPDGLVIAKVPRRARRTTRARRWRWGDAVNMTERR